MVWNMYIRLYHEVHEEIGPSTMDVTTHIDNLLRLQNYLDELLDVMEIRKEKGKRVKDVIDRTSMRIWKWKILERMVWIVLTLEKLWIVKRYFGRCS